MKDIKSEESRIVDNGLLKYYRGFRRGKDLLNVNRHAGFKFVTKAVGVNNISADGVLHYLVTPEGLYYTKFLSKKEIDAEVLISQLYPKLGLKCATYLPVGEKSTYTGVVSNDVRAIDTVPANQHNKAMSNSLDKSIHIVGKNPLHLPYDSNLVNVDYSKFITKNGMRSLQIKRMADTASYNTDGREENFFYVLKDGIIDDVVSYDNAMSGPFCEGLTNSYENEFSAHRLYRNGMINQFRENETLQTFISPIEMAETIGSVDVIETAKDIKRETGYKVEPQYVDAIARSYESMAEDLTR